MSRSFNGTTDVITTGNTSGDSTSTLSGACWVLETNTQSFEAALQKDDIDTDGNRCWSLFSRASGAGPQVFVFGAGSSSSVHSATTLNTGTWVHLGFSYTFVANGSSILNLYINGVKDAASITTAVGPINSFSIPIVLGERNGNISVGLIGSLADCAVWNAVLSDGEFLALANGARPFLVRPASLFGYWPLDGLQSPEPDLSGNANNGTLTGTARAAGPPVSLFTPRNQLLTPPMVLPSGPLVTTTLTNKPAKAFMRRHYREEIDRIREDGELARRALEGLSERDLADRDYEAAKAEFDAYDQNLGISNYAKAADAKEKLAKARKARDHHYYMDIVNQEIAKYKSKNG